MQSQRKYRRIVIKIGSSLFYSKSDMLNSGLVSSIALEISNLIRNSQEVILVSSGAIALGMSILKLENRPKELSYLQAAAAIGQHELMDVYRRSFKAHDLNCAQLLLTWEDFSDRKRYLNAKSTLNTLLKLKCVPIINENDTVSTDEIKFGDNDRLSALVASLVDADLLIILSDVDGLLDKGNRVIKVVDKVTAEIKSLACPTNKKTCVGGMITKIEAARIAVESGIPCVIANGQSKGIINAVVSDKDGCGTLFLAQGTLLDAKKRWMAFGTKVKGKIIVDDGAVKALVNKKSLLAVGIIASLGNFSSGDVVSICDKKQNEFARGKVSLEKKELEKIMGEHFNKEIIHRDNIVIL